MIRTAMVLAAGEGRRMRPLTLTCPKPLLEVGSRRLIEWHLIRLQQAGVQRVIINVAYLGRQIVDFLGDGERYDLELVYSEEPEPLETGGALRQALPLLGDDCFLLVNGDIWFELDFQPLLMRSVDHIHLLMVDNPAHNPAGDFSLEADHVIHRLPDKGLTFSGVSLVNPQMIASYPRLRTRFRLREVYDWLIDAQQLTGEFCDAHWMDIGTPERLAQLRCALR